MYIKNVARNTQFIDYDGLADHDIRPMDVDGIIEYHDWAYILLEFKFKEAELPAGQRICLERMVKDFRKLGKTAVAVVVRHTVADPYLPVHIAEFPVSELYDGVRWRKPRTPCNAKTFVTETINNFKLKERGL